MYSITKVDIINVYEPNRNCIYGISVSKKVIISGNAGNNILMAIDMELRQQI